MVPQTIREIDLRWFWIADFSKFGWTTLLANKYAPTITHSFSQRVIATKRKSYFIETDGGKEYLNKVFNTFPEQQNI